MCFISSLGFTCRNKDLRGSLSKNHMETTRLCPPKRDECTHHMHGSSFVERHYHSSNLVRELYLVSLAGRSSLHSPLISNFPSSRQFGKPQNSTKKIPLSNRHSQTHSVHERLLIYSYLSRHHVPTNSVASFSAHYYTHNPQFPRSLWRTKNLLANIYNI